MIKHKWKALNNLYNNYIYTLRVLNGSKVINEILLLIYKKVFRVLF